MKIAIWTQNPAKLEAIKSWIEKCDYLDETTAEILTASVDSWVSDMPTTLEENIKWAQNRAKNLFDVYEDADFCIGMEWGTSYIQDKAYLFGVVYIYDKNMEGHFGVSNMMEVPEVFRRRIYENGEELGSVLEELTWVEDASKKNWAFGAWSDDILTRTDQFVLAFLSAVPPFFNKFYKK